MEELRLCFPIDDIEMKQAIEKEFGKDVTFIEERSATGMEILLVAIVPIVSLTVEIIDFVLTHLVKKKEKEEPKKKERRIEVYKSRIVLYEYPPDEAIRILKKVYNK